MTTTIRMLGIDPALRNTGMAIADYNFMTGELTVRKVLIAQTEKTQDHKVVRKSSDDFARARFIFQELNRAIAEHSPNLAVAELPTGTQSARGAFSNGVCCGVLSGLTLPLIEVSPTEVKMASIGKKTATKDEIIQWAVGKWPEAGWLSRKFKGEVQLIADNEHMADACAAIAAGVLTPAFAQAISMLTAMKSMRAA